MAPIGGKCKLRQDDMTRLLLSIASQYFLPRYALKSSLGVTTSIGTGL